MPRCLKLYAFPLSYNLIANLVFEIFVSGYKDGKVGELVKLNKFSTKMLQVLTVKNILRVDGFIKSRH